MESIGALLLFVFEVQSPWGKSITMRLRTVMDLPCGDLTCIIPDALAHTYYERLASCAYSNGNSIAIGISAGKASGKGKNIFDVRERVNIFDVGINGGHL